MTTLAKAISKARDADNLNIAISPRASKIGKTARNVSKILPIQPYYCKHCKNYLQYYITSALTVSKYYTS